ncbi:MAG: peptide/nickel transport system ATP-binding protein [Pseudomonadales bacterium]|jgi:peptide/nickel transport system ATP-binding protein
MTALSIMQLLPRGAESQGSVHFDGRTLNMLSEEQLCDIRGSDIGMIFQEPMTALNPVKTIGDQVSESIRLHRKVSAAEAVKLTAQTLERVGLPNSEFPLGRYPHELSGGQRQRVVIAIAVACEPKLLIADEPTTALDVTTQAGILDLLKTLQRDEGLALMLITHDLAVVSNMADDVVVMKKGEIVEQGNLSTVFRNPSNPYTRLLFDASALTQISRSKLTLSASRQSEAEKSAPLLQVSNLVCEYKMPRAGFFKSPTSFRAVNEISFDIRHGESIGLVGESGCGKSTLTRALLGLMKLHSGSVLLNGESVSTTKEVSRTARQQMQVVFQDPYGSFNPRQKVGRLISEPLFLLDKRPGKAETQILVRDVLESVGMSDSDADKFIHEFSGGQRQRIAIARALIIKPSLIILDEAVSALDVSVRAQVLELLHVLAQKEGLAYLFISHDLSVVQRVSDRVLVMEKGKIVERGDTSTVFSQPQHPYTQQLIAAAPKLSVLDR